MSAASKFDFDQLYKLKQFIDSLRERHVRSLIPFEDKQSQGFKQSEARNDKADLSMSSTATCIGSLVQAGMWQARIDSSSPEHGWWVGREHIYVRKLLTEPWDSAGLPTKNPFTVGFVVEACAHLQMVTDQRISDPTLIRLHEEARHILHSALMDRTKDDTPRGSVSVLKYPPSAYLTQLVARTLTAVGELKEDEADAITKWGLNEITTQLTLIGANSRAADPLQLVYAILCAISYRPSFVRTPIDLDVVRFALECFFNKQLPNGGWPQSKPLFHYPQFGSAYCYDYEALAQVLACQQLHEMLFDFLPQLGKAAYALEVAKFELSNGGYGWAWNQTPQLPGPKSWSTASVYFYLFGLDRFLAEAIRRTVADEVEAPYSGIREPKKILRNLLLTS